MLSVKPLCNLTKTFIIEHQVFAISKQPHEVSYAYFDIANIYIILQKANFFFTNINNFATHLTSRFFPLPYYPPYNISLAIHAQASASANAW